MGNPKEEDLLPVNGGLNLPKFVGSGESLIERTKKRWDTLEEVEQVLTHLKLPELKEPTVTAPEVTAEMLLTPDTKEYTVMFANVRIWYGYVNSLLARTKAALLEVENQLENLEAELRKKVRDHSKGAAKADRLTAEQVGDEVKTDPGWQDLKLREQKLQQNKLLVGAWFENLDRQLRVVSRQVEIRRDDNQGGRNEENMPSRGTFAGHRPGAPR